MRYQTSDIKQIKNISNEMNIFSAVQQNQTKIGNEFRLKTRTAEVVFISFDTFRVQHTTSDI